MVSFQEKKIKNFFYQNTSVKSFSENYSTFKKFFNISTSFDIGKSSAITNFYTSSDSVLNTNEISILSAIITFASSHCDTCVFHTVQFGCPFRSIFSLYIYIYIIELVIVTEPEGSPLAVIIP